MKKNRFQSQNIACIHHHAAEGLGGCGTGLPGGSEEFPFDGLVRIIHQRPDCEPPHPIPLRPQCPGGVAEEPGQLPSPQGLQALKYEKLAQHIRLQRRQGGAAPHRRQQVPFRLLHVRSPGEKPRLAVMLRQLQQAAGSQRTGRGGKRKRVFE